MEEADAHDHGEKKAAAKEGEQLGGRHRRSHPRRLLRVVLTILGRPRRKPFPKFPQTRQSIRGLCQTLLRRRRRGSLLVLLCLLQVGIPYLSPLGLRAV